METKELEVIRNFSNPTQKDSRISLVALKEGVSEKEGGKELS